MVADRYFDVVRLGSLDRGRQQDGAAARRAYPVITLLLLDKIEYLVADTNAPQVITADG